MVVRTMCRQLYESQNKNKPRTLCSLLSLLFSHISCMELRSTEVSVSQVESDTAAAGGVEGMVRRADSAGKVQSESQQWPVHQPATGRPSARQRAGSATLAANNRPAGAPGRCVSEFPTMTGIGLLHVWNEVFVVQLTSGILLTASHLAHLATRLETCLIIGAGEDYVVVSCQGTERGRGSLTDLMGACDGGQHVHGMG